MKKVEDNMNKSSKIFIAGHKGMVGSSLVRLLKKQDIEIITREKKDLEIFRPYPPL